MESSLQETMVALEESRRLLQTLFRQMPIPSVVYQKTTAGLVLANYNEAMAGLTRQGIGAFLGKTAAEIYADRPDILLALTSCLEEHVAVEYCTAYHILSTGDETFLALTFAPVDDNLVLLHIQDITEPRRAEMQTREWNRQLEQRVAERTRELVNEVAERQRVAESLQRALRTVQRDEATLAQAGYMAHLGAWEIDLSNTQDVNAGTLRWSEEVYRIFGYEPGRVEVTNALFFQHVHPDDRPRVAGAVAQALATRQPYAVEHRVVRPDGAERVVMEHAEVIFDEQGRPVRVIGAVQDITEQKRAAVERERMMELLDAEQARWKATVESMLDPVTVADAEGHATYMNPAYSQLIERPIQEGLDLDEHPSYYQIYRPDGTLFPPEELPLQRATRRGEPVRGVEIVQRTATGQEYILVFNAAPLHSKDGRIAGAVAVGRDVTAQRRAEKSNEKLTRELQQRAVELEIANRELEAFSYSVSHDLRTPLASIDGFSRLLLSDYGDQLPEPGQRYLRLIREGTLSMERLIQDLLAFSRTTRQPLKKETVQPSHLVGEALEELRGAQLGRRIELVIGELPPCRADPVLLKQVWVNLLSNAFKFTRRSEVAHIDIGAYREGSEMVYFVKDDGAGFDMEQADKLFGVFRRLHSEDEFEGNGVGLAIVGRIVRRHGGRIWAEAKVNQGATFCFTLPLSDDRGAGE